MGFEHAAMPLFERAGDNDRRDYGVIALEGPAGGAEFFATCRQLRFWARAAVATPV
jgi:hypothetical protein